MGRVMGRGRGRNRDRGDLVALSERVLPFAKEIDFEIKRDLDRVYVGMYSFSGADLLAVMSGRFDQAKLEAAGAKLKVEFMHILAPFDGIVEAIDTEVGEMLDPQRPGRGGEQHHPRDLAVGRRDALVAALHTARSVFALAER